MPKGHDFVPWVSFALSYLTSLHIIGDMGVGVQGEARTEVAQHTGQGLHTHTAGDCHRGKGMTEIMKPHAPKSYVIPSPKYYCFPFG